MKTIEEISNKIHVLSLNASVIAARAGEAGIPFEVVAKEIRKLSEDVKSSISDIRNKSDILKKQINRVKELITSVNNEIKSTYDDITATIERFEGIYLSLNIIDKKYDFSSKKNTELIEFISSNINNYIGSHDQIFQNLRLNDLKCVNDHFLAINNEIDNIEEITNKCFKGNDILFYDK